MLKNFFSVIALIIAISISNFAAAENFVSFGNDGGYADLDSVKVENYNPPTYILSVVTYSYDGNNSNRTKFRLNYDKKTVEIYLSETQIQLERGRAMAEQFRGGRFRARTNSGWNDANSEERELGITLWEKAYKMKFVK